MDKYTAARLLGVAAYTIEQVEATADGWYATVRDMSTHDRARRLVPGAPAPVPAVEIAVDDVWHDVTEHRTAEPSAKPVARSSAKPPRKPKASGR